jgi:hypothetical protein
LQSSNPAFVGLDFSTALLSDPKFDAVVMNAPVGAVAINALGASNIQPGEVCSFTNGNVTGGMAPFSGGIDSTSVRFRFNANGGITDSTITANPRLTATTLVTLTQNVFTKVTTNWASSLSERLSVSADGDIENITEQTVRIGFDGYVTVEKVGGGSDFVEARLVLNDLPLSPISEATKNGTQNNQPTSIPLNEVFDLAPGDSISIYIANIDSNSDVNVFNGKMKCNRLR